MKQEDSAEVEEESFLYCKHCNFIITSPSHRIEIAGAHSHTFRNPAGIVFRIGCFSSAKGCFHFGEPTAEHSWFPGYSWSFANCLNCFQHMGWLFQSGDSHFYGLILNNLVSKR
ncbi:MAG: hypothetical protein GY757_44025 [bacterium]|nr:hypothetical protein [bacterium]